MLESLGGACPTLPSRVPDRTLEDNVYLDRSHPCRTGTGLEGKLHSIAYRHICFAGLGILNVVRGWAARRQEVARWTWQQRQKKARLSKVGDEAKRRKFQVVHRRERR